MLCFRAFLGVSVRLRAQGLDVVSGVEFTGLSFRVWVRGVPSLVGGNLSCPEPPKPLN